MEIVLVQRDKVVDIRVGGVKVAIFVSAVAQRERVQVGLPDDLFLAGIHDRVTVVVAG